MNELAELFDYEYHPCDDHAFFFAQHFGKDSPLLCNRCFRIAEKHQQRRVPSTRGVKP